MSRLLTGFLALFFLLFYTGIGDGEPRLLLASFVCLAVSVCRAVLLLTNMITRR
mgnify:CR=1 FL=1